MGNNCSADEDQDIAQAQHLWTAFGDATKLLQAECRLIHSDWGFCSNTADSAGADGKTFFPTQRAGSERVEFRCCIPSLALTGMVYWSVVKTREEINDLSRLLLTIPAQSKYCRGVLEDSPEWVADESADVCSACNNEFGSGIRRSRRHHCRSCGDLFCSSCCNKKQQLELYLDKPQLVCNDCDSKIANHLREQKTLHEQLHKLSAGVTTCQGSTMQLQSVMHSSAAKPGCAGSTAQLQSQQQQEEYFIQSALTDSPEIPRRNTDATMIEHASAGEGASPEGEDLDEVPLYLHLQSISGDLVNEPNSEQDLHLSSIHEPQHMTGRTYYAAHISSDASGEHHPTTVEKVVYHHPNLKSPDGLDSPERTVRQAGDSKFEVRIDQPTAETTSTRPHIHIDIHFEKHIAKAVFRGSFPKVSESSVHKLLVPQAHTMTLKSCDTLVNILGGSAYFETADQRVIEFFKFLQVGKQLHRLMPEEAHAPMVRYAGICRAVTDYDQYGTPIGVPGFVELSEQAVLSVFIEGTSRYLDQQVGDQKAVLGNLYRACVGNHLDHGNHGDHTHSSMANDKAYLARVSNILAKHQLEKQDRNFKIGFNGCSSYNPKGDINPTICMIVARVSAMLAARPDLHVRVNVLGFSRGAVTAMILTKRLNDLDVGLASAAQRVTVNLALVDPVPGDSFREVESDTDLNTLTAEASDLSQCHVLERVLTLYAEDTTRHSMSFLPDVLNPGTYFNPVVPRYPANCSVVVDVVPGEHSTWQGIKKPEHSIKKATGVAALGAFYKLKDFLHNANSRFSGDWPSEFDCTADQFPDEHECMRRMETCLAERIKAGVDQSRPCHHYESTEVATIVRHKNAAFLNKHHEQLCLKHTTRHFNTTQYYNTGSAMPDACLGPECFIRCQSLAVKEGIELSTPSYSSKYISIVTVSDTSTGLLPGDWLHSIMRDGVARWKQFEAWQDKEKMQMELLKLQAQYKDDNESEYVFYRAPRQSQRYLLCVEFDGIAMDTC